MCPFDSIIATYERLSSDLGNFDGPTFKTNRTFSSSEGMVRLGMSAWGGKVLRAVFAKKSQHPRVAILLPEPHLETGGNNTLVDFLVAASKKCRVQVLFVRYPKKKSDRNSLKAHIRRRTGKRVRVTWLCRLLDSNLARGVSWIAIMRGEIRWTTIRFLLDPRRFGAYWSLRTVDVLLTSQYVTPRGVGLFRRISRGRMVLNLAGHPEQLRQNFCRPGVDGSSAMSIREYSDYLRSIGMFLLQTGEHRSIFCAMEPWAESSAIVIKPSVDVSRLSMEYCNQDMPCSIFEPDRKVILNVGKLGLKGQELALAAFEKIASSNSMWDLHFVGGLDSNPSFVAHLRKQVAIFGLEDRTYFWGHRQDLGHFLKCADLLLLSSQYEGAPRVLREAMFVGLPIVTVPIPGVTEMVGQRTAFVAEERDEKSLKVALLEALKDPGLRANKAAGAKRDFSLHMSPKQYEASVLAFVDSVLHKF